MLLQGIQVLNGGKIVSRVYCDILEGLQPNLAQERGCYG